MRRRLGDERAAPRLAHDQPVLREPLHGVAGRHPADPELGAQLRVGRQRVARPQGRDALAEGLLDLAGSAAGRSPGSRRGLGGPADAAAPPVSAARSAPCTAAPIAPAQVPAPP